MIIAVSDVHLGYRQSNEKDFEQFICEFVVPTLSSDDHFILLGDIIDFWRRDNIEPVLKNQKTWEQISTLVDKGVDVHYVIGNHDYYLNAIKERFPEYRALDLRKYLQLEYNGISYFFIHGYELDVLANYEPLTLKEYERISEELCRTGNILGDFLSRLWGIKSKLSKPPQKRTSWKKRDEKFLSKADHMGNVKKFACSKARNLFLGMKNDEKLVFGHTHRPFINDDTVNTGCWVKDASKYNTYLIIDDGKWHLKTWRH